MSQSTFVNLLHSQVVHLEVVALAEEKMAITAHSLKCHRVAAVEHSIPAKEGASATQDSLVRVVHTLTTVSTDTWKTVHTAHATQALSGFSVNTSATRKLTATVMADALPLDSVNVTPALPAQIAKKNAVASAHVSASNASVMDAITDNSVMSSAPITASAMMITQPAIAMTSSLGTCASSLVAQVTTSIAMEMVTATLSSSNVFVTLAGRAMHVTKRTVLASLTARPEDNAASPSNHRVVSIALALGWELVALIRA